MSPSAGRHALLLAASALVFWATFRVVPATNFGGYDEWLGLSLLSRGVIGYPYANRPLALLTMAPVEWLAGPSLEAHRLGFAASIVLGGALCYALARRLAPELPAFAFLCATFFQAYAPSDVSRLSTASPYAGFTLLMLLAAVLCVESWVRRRAWLLAAAAAAGFVAVRAYEGTLAFLLAAPPLLLMSLEARVTRRLAVWSLGFASGPLAAAALVAAPLLVTTDTAAYQTARLGLATSAQQVLTHLTRQYEFHLLPLLLTPPSAVKFATAGPALVLLAAALVWAERRLRDPASTVPSPRRLASLAGLGVALAGLGYGFVVLTNTVPAPYRMEFLSAPGIALALAALVHLLAAVLQPRWRALAVGVLAAWIVVVGSTRTVLLQGVWGHIGLFPAQSSLLRQLVQLAPGIRSNTLVILVGGGRVFPEVFSFRHALDLMYGPDVVGYVSAAQSFLYPTRFGTDGIVAEPWPIVRGPWRMGVTRHRYDETMVFEVTASGELQLLEGWPDSLPALPAGARYAPLERRQAAPAPARPARALVTDHP